MTRKEFLESILPHSDLTGITKEEIVKIAVEAMVIADGNPNWNKVSEVLPPHGAIVIGAYKGSEGPLMRQDSTHIVWYDENYALFHDYYTGKRIPITHWLYRPLIEE